MFNTVFKKFTAAATGAAVFFGIVGKAAGNDGLTAAAIIVAIVAGIFFLALQVNKAF